MCFVLHAVNYSGCSSTGLRDIFHQGLRVAPVSPVFLPFLGRGNSLGLLNWSAESVGAGTSASMCFFVFLFHRLLVALSTARFL